MLSGYPFICRIVRETKGTSPQGRKFLPGCLAISLFFLLFCVFLVFAFQNRTGMNVTREEAPFSLPEDATNISYFFPGAFGPNTFCEFDTSEKGYREWVDSPQEIQIINEERPVDILRYDHHQKKIISIVIKDGLFHSWTEEDRGIYHAYDREHGRAYYHSHSR